MAERPQGRMVLVADDEVAWRQTTAEYLRQHGFEVVEASNGLEVLRQVDRLQPEAVVLDLMMPRLSGLDALTPLRAVNPAITIVVVTGVDDPELHRQALALGAAQVLQKPVAPAELLAALGSPAGQPGGSPATPALQREPAAAPVAELAPAARILVVDDEAQTRAMLAELLTRYGYRVRVAADGAAAVRAVLDETPDLVLLDITMPGLTGIEALTAIRAIASGVKVIMVSGQENLDVAKRTLAYGAFDYITKPVDPTYLTVSLQAALAWKGLAGG